MSVDPKLDTLKNRIHKAEKALKSSLPPKPSHQKPAFQFINAGVDLVAGIVMGAGLGLLVDKIFDISPWGLVTFFVLGSVAGLLNMYRALTGRSSRHKNQHHD